jgi:hypothetical protein
MSSHLPRNASRRCGTALLLLFGTFLLASPSSAQTTISRDVVAGGSGTTSSGGHSVRGTVSQTAVGRLTHASTDRHDVGFWYRAYQPEVIARVSFPLLEAEVGTRVTIPLLLTTTTARKPFFERPFRARVRFNGTLLHPAGSTPPCAYDGDDCVIEISGVASGDGTIAALEFIVALGNAERTPLVIESFEWYAKHEDERIATTRENGELALLGVCREGDEIRLIRSGAFLSRLRAWPNPVTSSGTVEFVSAETGPVSVLLVDMLGNTVATLVERNAEAQRLYQVAIDLENISSGSYHLVYITPSQRISQRLLIMQ